MVFYKHMITDEAFEDFKVEQTADDDFVYEELGGYSHKDFNFALLNLGSLLKIIAIYFELKQDNINDYMKLEKELTRDSKMEKIAKELNAKINLRYEFPEDVEVIKGLYTYKTDGYLLIDKLTFLRQVMNKDVDYTFI